MTPEQLKELRNRLRSICSLTAEMIENIDRGDLQEAHDTWWDYVDDDIAKVKSLLELF